MDIVVAAVEDTMGVAAEEGVDTVGAVEVVVSYRLNYLYVCTTYLPVPIILLYIY